MAKDAAPVAATAPSLEEAAPILTLEHQPYYRGYFVAPTDRPAFIVASEGEIESVEVFEGDALIARGERRSRDGWKARSLRRMTPGLHQLHAVVVFSDGRRSAPSKARHVAVPGHDSIELANLPGAAGFRFDGLQKAARLGEQVAGLGDVNGDAIDDFGVLAPGPSSSRHALVSTLFVVFGSSDIASQRVNLKTLDGTRGFRVVGSLDQFRLRSIAPAGDVNGDGIADILIGSESAKPADGTLGGRVTILYGRAGGFSAELRMEELLPAEGATIQGAPNDGFRGGPIAGGADLNGDGISDILLGAPGAGPCGAAFAVYGRAGGPPAVTELSQIDATTGLKLTCTKKSAALGAAVAFVGDLNDDGVGDFAVGAPYTANRDGSAAVIFGGPRPEWLIDAFAVPWVEGFRVLGRSPGTGYLGASIAGGHDVDGNGIDDLIVDGGLGVIVGGRASPFPKFIVANDKLSDLDRIIWSQSESFQAVAVAADFNGDGRADIVGSSSSTFDPTSKPVVHVVYGTPAGFPKLLTLESLLPMSGLRIVFPGGKRTDVPPQVAAADINHDGLSDLIFGVPDADAGRRNEVGSVFVLFGRPTPAAP